MTRPVKPWAALSALCLGFFMILLDGSIVNVAIPSMIGSLHASLNEVFWVNSIYLLAFAVPLLLTGRLGDRFGPRRLYLIGLVIFTLASLMCGLADNATTLIIARAVQGLGAAALTPQSMAFTTYLFPTNRGAAMGVWAGVAGVATAAGPLIGGVLVQTLGWESIFFVNIPIGIAGIALILTFVPNWQPRNSHRFDFLGIALSSVGLLALVFGLQNGEQYDWGTVFGGITVTEIIVAGVILLAAFIFWQARNKKEPLLPLVLFSSKTFSFGNLTNMTIGFSLTAMLVPFVIFLQTVRGLTPLAAALLFAPMSMVSGLVGPFTGRLSDRIDGKYIAMTGMVAFAGGLAWMTLVMAPDVSPAAVVPGLVLTGAGLGCIFSPLTSASIAELQPRLMGAGAGIFNMSRQVGSVLGSAGAGVLLQARVVANPGDLTTAIQETMILPIGGLILGALFATGMRRRVQPDQPAGQNVGSVKENPVKVDLPQGQDA
jgi:EmrB/QacA subfamily drug resistance transporter